MKILLILLLLVSLGFGQEAIFGTAAAPQDTASLTDATATTGRLITFNAKPEGVATLFMAGDSVSGAPIGVVGEWRLYMGKTLDGDDFYGPWRTIGDSVLVKADIVNPAVYGTGTIVGRETNMAEETEWSLSKGVQFRFTGVGTQVTLLIGWLDFF
jgi:hypothetical protein